jgi:type I restriction enzyme S subunit
VKAGWKTKRVGEIAQHSLGKMLDRAKNKGTPRPYLRNLNVRWFEFDLSDLLEMPFQPSEAERYTAVKGDVLVCEGGYPGRAAIWDRDEPVYFQKALHRVRFHEPERNRWFLYYLRLKDLDGTLKDHFNGSGIQHFTGEALARFEVPLPPLPEQRRIVALLDEAFAGLATAAANAERNLDNARELFESHLAEVFSWRGDGWVETTLGEIADFKNGLNYTRSSRGQTIPFVGVGDFKSNLVVPVAELESVTIDGVLPPDYALENGDILMVRSNGSRDLVGRSMLVPPMEGPTSFSGFLIRVRGKRSAVDPEFLVYLLRCRDTKEQLKRGGGGASISNINQKVLAGLRLRLPPKMAQRRVVKLLDALSLETDRLSRLYEQKQAALAELKKSLLHQAFSGAL